MKWYAPEEVVGWKFVDDLALKVMVFITEHADWFEELSDLEGSISLDITANYKQALFIL